MKKLPIGIQTFETLIEDDYLYIDKTADIFRMITEGRMYFLSRPRRFGKSLLVTTLKSIFKGERELFKGLAIDNLDYDWQKYSVLHFDFGSKKSLSAEELERHLIYALDDNAAKLNVTLERIGVSARLEELIKKTAQFAKVVVLIDEYDKPILDNIDNREVANKIREVLKGFYTTIKSSDEYLRFVLLTGVSKFAKMSVFSGLNNLQDITMDKDFSTMLGYTQSELEVCFADRIAALCGVEGLSHDACLTKIREWYNGYCFSANSEKVYNPFSTLLLFKQQEFKNYWFETGTPSFLIKLIKSQNYDVAGNDILEVDELGFSAYEPESLRVEPLLFQTGYITIRDYDKETGLYSLGYPNNEVKGAFMRYLLEAFSAVSKEVSAAPLVELQKYLEAGKMEDFFETLAIFFAHVEYDLYLKNEKYYQTIFYLVFKLLGMRIATEVKTNRGRIDAVAETDDTIFLFEFKLQGTVVDALTQIHDTDYARKYQGGTKIVRVFGVVFDVETRNIGEWEEG